MAPSEKQPFYDPVPPTYDEALAGSSRQYPDWERSRSPLDERPLNESESQSLLHRSNGAGSSSRRPGGYRAPTVESDDSSDLDSLLESDSEDDEASEVRREMQEMDIEEPGHSRGSLWGKTIGFALPKWKWSWRPRLPSLPRMRIQLPSREPAAEDDGGESGEQTQTTTSRWRIKWPKINGMLALIIFARALAIFVVMGFVWLIFASDLLGNFGNRLGGGFRFDPEDLRVHVMKSIDTQRLRASVKHFASYAHIAGTEGDFATAMDVESMFSRAGLDEVKLDEYVVYLNYPTADGRAVEIMDDSGENAIWSAKLEEEEVGEETAGHQTYAFHGHSKSGDVKGPLIYANYGSREDFQKIKDMGIETDGAIALVRYYGTQTDRALKVKAAELAGFAGCIIYSDPGDDGSALGTVAPDGRYMPEDGVQRGSVSLMSWVVGDVLTPGWESKDGQPRMKVEDNPGLVKIPSLPLSWRDGRVLLDHLKGYGQTVPDGWQGRDRTIEWWTGNSSSPTVRLKNLQDEVDKQPIWNVYGKIMGMEQTAKSVIIGNHRDAWGFGATDPHSGTAIMIEMARIFGDLVMRGWRPLRTIHFMSWDAEEYNLIGSTEYVENNLQALRDNAYAYINLDTAVFGNEFHAAGSPVFEKTLMHALSRVADVSANVTLKDLWDERGGKLEGLGAGSDYVAFQDIAGTSSLDLEFRGQPYPYHSSYDNFDQVENVIDPGFAYHGVMAQVVGLLMLDIADRPIVPFDMGAYGNRLGEWVDDLEKWAEGKVDKRDDASKLDFKELRDAAGLVKLNADEFDKWEMEWDRAIMASGNWEANDLTNMRLEYNNKMGYFDTALLDTELGGGIPDRPQFKHTVFGPQLWSGYDEAFFPAIRDMIDAKRWDDAKRQIAKTSAIFRAASTTLQMGNSGED